MQLALLDLASRAARFLPGDALITLDGTGLLVAEVCFGLGALVMATAMAERFGGATLGKLVTGLRVIRADGGGSIPLSAAVVRNLALIVDAFALGIVGYSVMRRSERSQRMGDLWAGTVVVWRADAPRTTPWGVPVGIVLALGLLVGSYVIVG